MGNFLFPERLIAPPKVTYYPNEPIDYSTLPVTDEYPIVDCVTLKTLPFLARVGMIVTTEIENRSGKSKYIFSYLNEKNCIELLEKKKAEKIQKSSNKSIVFLKWNCYRQFKFLVKCKRALLSR